MNAFYPQGYALGLMSGTSADGITFALCQFKQKKVVVHGVHTYSYPEKIRQLILRGPQLSLTDAAWLHFKIGELSAIYAQKFLKRCRFSSQRLDVIGSHGQTLLHAPHLRPRVSLQVGEPSFLAQRFHVPVVSDFRSADLALGGEGAPFVPFFENAFLGKRDPALWVNIGGISNMTLLGENAPLIALDAGPGNCWMDAAIAQLTQGKKKWDTGGAWAARGVVEKKFLLELLCHPYFKKAPPKSIGREAFTLAHLPEKFCNWMKQNPADALATLNMLTAQVIFGAYRKFIFPHKKVNRVWVSGGGAENNKLMENLRALFFPVTVQKTESAGIPSEAKEAAAFAYFALCAVRKKSAHGAKVTGAHRKIFIGKVSYP